MAISAKMVKELREKTGAGMMDCKKALTESNGDIDEAIEYLRKKGVSKAAKKETRVAAEGLTYIKVNQNKAVIVEVNSETDFVAKNDHFKSLIDQIANHLLACKPDTIDEALDHKVSDSDKTLKDSITDVVAKIGEKISLRRFQVVEKSDDETFGSYMHMGGRIGVLTVLSGSEKDDIAKDIAMHVAAVNPQYLSRDEVPENVVEAEKAMLKEQAMNEGKPENIVEKMVTGRLNKYFQEICLLDQDFVKDPDQKIGKYVENNGTSIQSYVRYEVGEGMDKKEDNFAEEVKEQINQ